MFAGHPGEEADAADRHVDLFVEDQGAIGAQSAPRRLAEIVAAPGSRAILYGEAGTGKSVALLKQAADLARQAETESEAQIPLFVRLNLFDRPAHGFDRLLEILGSEVGLPPDEMKRFWREGKRPFLFLLDGYNEVPPSCQEACVKALQELGQVVGHGILVTSRPTTSLDSLLRVGFKGKNIISLKDEQIYQFLDRLGVLRLYDQLTKPLKELVRNPFMLWALAQSVIATETSELPRNKGELYRAFVDRYLFEQRQVMQLPAPTRFHYGRVKKPIRRYWR